MAVLRPPASLETVCGGPNNPPAVAKEFVTTIHNADIEMMVSFFVRISPSFPMYYSGRDVAFAGGLGSVFLNSRDLSLRAFISFRRYWM